MEYGNPFKYQYQLCHCHINSYSLIWFLALMPHLSQLLNHLYDYFFCSLSLAPVDMKTALTLLFVMQQNSFNDYCLSFAE